MVDHEYIFQSGSIYKGIELNHLSRHKTGRRYRYVGFLPRSCDTLPSKHTYGPYVDSSRDLRHFVWTTTIRVVPSTGEEDRVSISVFTSQYRNIRNCDSYP